MRRREFVAGAAAGAMAAACRSLAVGAEEAEKGMKPSEVAPTHVEVVNCGELSVLFGDSTCHGMGRTGYCGIWSLTSAHEAHNAFVTSYAGFIFNSYRGLPVQLRRLGEHQVEFRLPGSALESRVLFTLREPHFLDCESTVVPQAASEPYLLQSWASYMNSPEDGDIYFRHEGRWIRAHSPQHGVEATYAPASLKDIEADLGHLSPEARKSNFVYGYSQQRFSEPFYYGRIRDMALAFFFDRGDEIRFTISPSGGGSSTIPGRTCPAWDWLWLIPHAQAGRPYTLRVRMVYKPHTDGEELLKEFQAWQPGAA